MLQPIAHGIDLVETHRIARLMTEHGDRFLNRCFTDDEQAYAKSQAKRASEHFAGRFAAKEAVLKALGTGLTQGIQWTEIEILRGDAGEPSLQLHGRAAEIAKARRIGRWLVSITHIQTHAQASVIALGDDRTVETR